MTLSDVVIILVRPSEPGNVGAVCRAMKNMGLSRLRLVSPAPMKTDLILARSVHAADVWEGAETFDTLAAASADCAVLVGTTRRRGQRRKNVTLPPAELAAWIRDRPGPGALAFGNERTGLEAPELGICNAASHIPADSSFPSLNLSHAVQIYAYELFRALNASPPPLNHPEGEWIPLDRSGIDALAASVTGSLASLGFYKQPGREEQEQFFRDVFARSGLTAREGKYMGDIFAKAARLGTR